MDRKGPLQLVLEKLAFGWSPEEPHRQHSHLPLARIYAALSYCYEHQAEMDADLERDHVETRELRRRWRVAVLRANSRVLGKLP